MKTVGFIPARGGSKSIKNKNIMDLNGKPLIFYALKACEDSENIEKVYVSTDSELIKKAVETFGFKKAAVISRTPETATDTATSESALLEFCQNYEFEKVVFLQATSPLTKGKDIDGAINLMKNEKSDSLLSVVKNFQFLWNINGTPMNYEPKKRPRRQDWSGYYIENGAFYISKRENILKSKCRISGKISFWEMNSKTLYEVDEPSDWKIIENLIDFN